MDPAISFHPDDCLMDLKLGFEVCRLQQNKYIIIKVALWAPIHTLSSQSLDRIWLPIFKCRESTKGQQFSSKLHHFHPHTQPISMWPALRLTWKYKNMGIYLLGKHVDIEAFWHSGS